MYILTMSHSGIAYKHLLLFKHNIIEVFFMGEKEYDRKSVIEYAKKWAYSRNPKYYNFDKIGGDCTSFASQCIYEGSGVMNYTKNTGWYYKNGNDKTPSWERVSLGYSYAKV